MKKKKKNQNDHSENKDVPVDPAPTPLPQLAKETNFHGYGKDFSVRKVRRLTPQLCEKESPGHVKAHSQHLNSSTVVDGPRMQSFAVLPTTFF